MPRYFTNRSDPITPSSFCTTMLVPAKRIKAVINTDQIPPYMLKAHDFHAKDGLGVEWMVSNSAANKRSIWKGGVSG